MKEAVVIHQFQMSSEKNLLPLAAGSIKSFINQDQLIRRKFNLDLIILRGSTKDIVDKYKNPEVLAFSVYSWNFNLSLEVAKTAKEKYPEVLTIFGGPMFGLTQNEDELKIFFKKFSQIDIIVHGIGEWAFRDLLYWKMNKLDISNIPGLAYRIEKGRDEFAITQTPVFDKNLDELPSPFLDGTFEELIRQHKGKITGALWETNRGCPFSCAFCIQGCRSFNKVLDFKLDRLQKELEWMGNHKIEYIFATDANFGIKKRDRDIAELIVQSKKDTGYPKFFMVNWMKNSSAKILDISRILNNGGIPSRITLSRQSFSLEALKAVKRDNIKLSTYDELKNEATLMDVESYTEIILGLPNEDKDAFVDGLTEVMDFNDKHFFVIYLCRLLHGTTMASVKSRNMYEFITKSCSIRFSRFKKSEDDDILENEEIVVGTRDMPEDDWKELYLISNLSLALYNCRLAYYLFGYYHNDNKLSVIDFTRFFIEVCSDKIKYPVCSSMINIIVKCQDNILEEKGSLVSIEGFGKGISLEPHEAACVVALNQKDEFYNEIGMMLLEYVGDIGNIRLLEELMEFQKAIIPTWKNSNEVVKDFNHNYIDFFNRIKAKEKNVSLREFSTKIHFKDTLNKTKTIDDFCKFRLTVAKLKTVEFLYYESGK